MKDNSPLQFVSVVIPAYNSEETIGLCLDSIMQLNYPKDRMEVIVIDNGSTDNTPEIIKRYPVTYLEESIKGPGAARNRGIENTKGEVIALLDSDCVVDENWLLEGEKASRYYDLCGGTILSYNPSNWIEIYSDQRKLLQNLERCLERRYLPTANMFVRKEVFTKIGMFDSTFPWAEDVDFSWRAFLSDFKLGIIHGATVRLKYEMTLLDLYTQYFKYGYGNFFVRLKYKDLPPESKAKLKDAKSNLVELSIMKIIKLHYWGLVDIFSQSGTQRFYRLVDAIRAGSIISGLCYAYFREYKKFVGKKLLKINVA